MYAASTVTSVPTTIEITIVLELTTVPPAGSVEPETGERQPRCPWP